MVTIQYLLPFMLTSSHRRSYCTAVVAFCLILRTGIVHKKERSCNPAQRRTNRKDYRPSISLVLRHQLSVQSSYITPPEETEGYQREYQNDDRIHEHANDQKIEWRFSNLRDRHIIAPTLFDERSRIVDTSHKRQKGLAESKLHRVQDRRMR